MTADHSKGSDHPTHTGEGVSLHLQRIGIHAEVKFGQPPRPTGTGGTPRMQLRENGLAGASNKVPRRVVFRTRKPVGGGHDQDGII